MDRFLSIIDRLGGVRDGDSLAYIHRMRAVFLAMLVVYPLFGINMLWDALTYPDEIKGLLPFYPPLLIYTVAPFVARVLRRPYAALLTGTAATIITLTVLAFTREGISDPSIGLIVIVPVYGYLFLGYRGGLVVSCLAFSALFGVAFLTPGEGGNALSVQSGDLINALTLCLLNSLGGLGIYSLFLAQSRSLDHA